MEPITGMKRSVRLIWLSFTMLFAGVIYAWSILKVPLGEEFGFTTAQLSTNYTILMWGWCAGSLTAGALFRRIGPKMLLPAGGLLSGLGFLLTSHLNGSIGMLFVTYGVLIGLGIGIICVCNITMTNAWFPDRRGLAIGVLMMTYGFSALIMGSLADRLMQMPQIGWRMVYTGIGVLMIVIFFLSGQIAKMPGAGEVPAAGVPVIREAIPSPAPAGEGEAPRTDVAEAAAASIPAQRLDLTTPQMLKRGTFWRYYLMIVLVNAVGNVVIGLGKDIAQSAGAIAAIATLLVGILSVCNGLGRIISGFLYDKCGRTFLFRATSILNGVAAIFLLISLLMHYVPRCIAGLILVGLGYGFVPTVWSTVLAEMYGQTHYAMHLSVINTTMFPTSAFSILIGVLVTATGSFAIPMVVLLACAGLAFFLGTTIREA